LLFVLFFFSSRRRHTRSKRDWSSDVCSSDLRRFHFPPIPVTEPIVGSGISLTGLPSSANSFSSELASFSYCAKILPSRMAPLSRSEERRVGKECRSRSARGHENIER